MCVNVCVWKLWLFLHAPPRRILGRQPFLLEAPRVLSPYRSLFLSLSLSFYLCHSACLSFFSIFFSFTLLSAQCRSRMPQLRWNGVDVISIALLETSISSQTGLGWLGERIKSRIARPKRFQLGTGGPCLTSQSSGHVQLDAFNSIQHICGIKAGRAMLTGRGGYETKENTDACDVWYRWCCWKFERVAGISASPTPPRRWIKHATNSTFAVHWLLWSYILKL